MSAYNPPIDSPAKLPSNVMLHAMLFSGVLHIVILLAVKLHPFESSPPSLPLFIELRTPPVPKPAKPDTQPHEIRKKSPPARAKEVEPAPKPVKQLPDSPSPPPTPEPAPSTPPIRLFTVPDPFAHTASAPAESAAGKDFNAGLRGRAHLPEGPKAEPVPESRAKLARDIGGALRPRDTFVEELRMPNGQLIAKTHSFSGVTCMIIEDNRPFGVPHGLIVNCPPSGPWKWTPLSG